MDKVEPWVEYTLEVLENKPYGQPDHSRRTQLRRIHFRRDLMDKYRWYFRYILAYYQVPVPQTVRSGLLGFLLQENRP